MKYLNYLLMGLWHVAYFVSFGYFLQNAPFNRADDGRLAVFYVFMNASQIDVLFCLSTAFLLWYNHRESATYKILNLLLLAGYIVFYALYLAKRYYHKESEVSTFWLACKPYVMIAISCVGIAAFAFRKAKLVSGKLNSFPES